MAHCEVCGQGLGLRQWFRCFQQRGRMTYPFRRTDGVRVPTPVRHLCKQCDRRARRYARREETQEDAEAQ